MQKLQNSSTPTNTNHKNYDIIKDQAILDNITTTITTQTKVKRGNRKLKQHWPSTRGNKESNKNFERERENWIISLSL